MSQNKIRLLEHLVHDVRQEGFDDPLLRHLQPREHMACHVRKRQAAQAAALRVLGLAQEREHRRHPAFPHQLLVHGGCWVTCVKFK